MNLRRHPLPVDVSRVQTFLPWWDKVLAAVVLALGCFAIGAIAWAAFLRP